MQSIKNVFNLVVDTMFKIILFPFKLWFSLPWYVHAVFLIVLFVVIFTIWMYFNKRKDLFKVYV